MEAKTLFQTERAAQITPVDTLVDNVNGVINSVAVITVGPALGHGMMVDAVTLAQIKACAETYPQGLKVKMSHAGDIGDIVGALTSFRISEDGTKLIADFHLLNQTQHRNYVLELAVKMPGSFGMSVAFSGIPDEVNGVRYARCSEIYSCDLVGEPAANPNGLFSRRFDEWTKNKGSAVASADAQSRNNTTLSKMENELLAQIGKMIDEKITAASAAFTAQLEDIKKANETSCSRIEEVAKLSNEAADKAAFAAVKEFSKTLGAPAGSAAAPSVPATPPIEKKFEVLVREHAEYSKSKAQAISETIKANGKAYAEYLSRVQTGGEIILF
jgi:hypothetical protein